MSRCLVGWWGGGTNPNLDVEALTWWGKFPWDLKGSLNVVWLGKKYMLFEFESSWEAKWVL